MLAANKSKKKQYLFIVSIFLFLLALVFLFYSLYLLPYLLLNFTYDVPEFIVLLLEKIQAYYDYPVNKSKILLWILLFIPGVLISYVSYYFSNADKKES
ncbi:MAG: hypothetical protein CK426_04280 [Legionella sp.]|nr:MAG: hypothetical protein CK423_03530 [Legionella sp.]PJD98904.1 MAG: hypothetical protein CK426_04280 [Legionella sp.]